MVISISIIISVCTESHSERLLGVWVGQLGCKYMSSQEGMTCKRKQGSELGVPQKARKARELLGGVSE